MRVGVGEIERREVPFFGVPGSQSSSIVRGRSGSRMSSDGFVSREICGEIVRVERIDEANDLSQKE